MGIASSFKALLGRAGADSQAQALERVRQVMLRQMDEQVAAEDHRRLESRINAARELVELWHLRPDLMQAIAAARGEQVASDCVAKVTAVFLKQRVGGRAFRGG